jgi:hypothetical protein
MGRTGGQRNRGFGRDSDIKWEGEMAESQHQGKEMEHDGIVVVLGAIELADVGKRWKGAR